MAYKYTNAKGKAYFLHAKARNLKSGKVQNLYYFSQKIGEGALDAVPAGYVVTESPNGLPLLKKSK